MKIAAIGKSCAIMLAAMWFVPASPATCQGQEPPPRPERERLRRHVAVLASPEFGGRGGPAARKAETYVTNKLRALGLEPLFPESSFTQDIPGEKPGQVIGRNVGAKLVGSDPTLADEWIIVSAHYDHLGSRNGVIFPGADDNASGVAMLLEVARCLVESPTRPRRGIMLVSFDLEEAGLLGSRHFVEEPPVPLDQVKLFLTADLIGGALGGVCKAEVFVVGTEHIPGLREAVAHAAAGLPIQPALLGSDLLVVNRSDYGPFRTRKVPYLFFSTGENPRYHTPQDTPESLDYPKLEAISKMVQEIVEKAGNLSSLPAWVEDPKPWIGEAEALRGVIRKLVASREKLKAGDIAVSVMNTTLERLDGIIARGTFSAMERAQIIRSAQFILLTVL